MKNLIKKILDENTTTLNFDLEESYYGLNTKNLIKENQEFGSEDILLQGHKGYRGKVFVHRNLNKPPYWTIKARRGEDAGIVIGYDKAVHLKNVTFVVGEKSRQCGIPRSRPPFRKTGS